MASAPNFDSVASHSKQADERIGKRLTELQGILSEIESVKQRDNLNIDGIKEDLQTAQNRHKEKKLVIVVTGATSAGKSTVINSLIRQRLLFTAEEHCTPCSVSIETLPNIEEPFFTKDKPTDSGERYDIDKCLKEFSDAKSSNKSDKPLYVFLKRDENDESVLRVENLRIVDSPGLYEEVSKDSVDTEGDAFVFAVDLDTGVKREELEKKLRETKGKGETPVRKAVFFVYNKCDIVERQNKKRFEQGKREKLKKAGSFLVDNHVYSNPEEAEERTFFLSAHLAHMARDHNSRIQSLKNEIVRVVECNSNHDMKAPVLLVVGGSEVGKTTVCEDLCKASPGNADLEAEVCDLSDLLDGAMSRTQGSSPRKIVVVDSPDKEAISQGDTLDKLQPVVLAIVIPATSSLKKIKENIENCLHQYSSGNEIHAFLVITKLNDKRLTSGEDTAREHEKSIRDHWKSLGRPDTSVVLLEKDNLMEQYEIAFSKFEAQLVEAALEKYEDTKLKRINDLAENVRKRTQEKLREKLEQLEKQERDFEESTRKLADVDDHTNILRGTRADRFLSQQFARLPEDEWQLDDLFRRFAQFCNNDLEEEFGKIIDKAIQHLEEEAKESAKKVLHARLSELGKRLDPSQTSGREALRNQLRELKELKSKVDDDEKTLVKLDRDLENAREAESRLTNESAKADIVSQNSKQQVETTRRDLPQIDEKLENCRRDQDALESEKRDMDRKKTNIDKELKSIRSAKGALETRMKNEKDQRDADRKYANDVVTGLVAGTGWIPGVNLATLSAAAAVSAKENDAQKSYEGKRREDDRELQRFEARENEQIRQRKDNEDSMHRLEREKNYNDRQMKDLGEKKEEAQRTIRRLEGQAMEDEKRRHEKMSRLEKQTEEKEKIARDRESFRNRKAPGRKQNFEKMKEELTETFPVHLKNVSEEMREEVQTELVQTSKRHVRDEVESLNMEKKQFEDFQTRLQDMSDGCDKKPTTALIGHCEKL